MNLLLDTNIVIRMMRGERGLLNHAARHRPGDIGISSIVLFELYYGAAKSVERGRNEAAIQRFMESFPELAFTIDDARFAGEMRETLRRRGTPVGPYDLLIAGQALARGLTLVTLNMREFIRIDGLRLEDWGQAA